MFRNGLVFRVIGVLLLVGLVAAGGFMAFRAGEASGISQAPAVATAISEASQNGQAVNLPPMMYGHGYGPGYPMMYGRHFGFFPGGICFSIFFLFLFLGALRMIFFRRMHHGGHMHGPWGRHGGDGVPPMFNEWHQRAHDEKTGEEKTSGSKA
ncbi:MAG: hypothetical protein K8S20_03000 [Chloroflexi bacterium]|nr:hypothetical protein [Chloroflexota bacterium]